MHPTDLSKLGINEKEAKIYLAVLEMGNGSAPSIAKKAGIPKSSTYEILSSLINKGLLRSYIKKSRKHFGAADPIIMTRTLEKQKQVLEEIMPELQAMFGEPRPRKPTVRFYEGKEGLKIIWNELLNEAKDVVAVSSIEATFDKLSEYFPKLSLERAKRKIPIRIISRDSAIARERQESGPGELRQVKVRESVVPFQSAFFAWKNKLVMITLKEDLSIIALESRDIYQTFLAMFEWLWADTSE